MLSLSTVLVFLLGAAVGWSAACVHSIAVHADETRTILAGLPCPACGMTGGSA